MSASITTLLRTLAPDPSLAQDDGFVSREPPRLEETSQRQQPVHWQSMPVLRTGLLFLIMAIAAVAAGIPYLQSQGLAGRAATVVSAESPTSAGNADRTVFASGIVEGRCRETEQYFELTGRLISINVSEGQRVHASELLATLDCSTWQHELAQAEASLAIALAEKERLLNGQRQESREVAEAEVRVAEVRTQQAHANFERSSRLVTSNAVSRQEFEDHQTGYLRAQAELELALSRAAEVKANAREDEIRMSDAKIALEQAQVAQAKTTLAKAELRAPTDGIVLKISAEIGELVGPQGEEAILTMVDTSELRVRAFVEELDAVRVREGMVVKVTADGWPDLFFPGQVLSCAPLMVPKRYLSNEPGERVDVKVREVVIRLDETDARNRLVVGLPVDVHFQTGG